MMRITHCLFPIVLLTVSVTASAQWKISATRLQRNLVSDLMAAQRPAADTFHFFGPTFSFQENVISKGFGLDNNTTATDSSWELPVNTTSLTITKNTFLYLNCYTDNVESYHITLTDNAQNTYTKTFTIRENHYQSPQETALSVWRKSASSAASASIPDSIHLQNITILLKKKNTAAPLHFVIGECKLYAHVQQQEPAKGLFFYQITGDTLNTSSSYTISNIGNSYPISTFTIYRDPTAQSFVFTPKDSMPENVLQQQTLVLLRDIVYKYPYYGEHHIDKVAVQHYLEGLLRTDASFSHKMHGLDSLINSFRDGHFYIEHATQPLAAGPVRVKMIKGSLYITAVFDPTLQSKVHAGNRLLAVDGIPVNERLKKVTVRYYGDKLSQQNQAINNLLSKAASDSTTLTIVDKGIKKQVTYYYNGTNIVPANFKPVHGNAIVQGDNFYLKLNRWDVGDWLSFYNHRQELLQCKSIVFDLRGNTGGAEVEAFKFFSCFLKAPVTVSYSQYAGSNAKYPGAPNIVEPNPYLNLSDKKILILVDNNTACASEIFTKVLRKYAGARVVGSEKTAGSYASGDVFYLPYQLTVHVNMLNKFIERNGRNNIEMNGIVPDIKVSLNTYQDLYPYQDKILHTAYLLLRQRQHNPGYTNLIY